jgi:L-glutamine-phosphate cytidylyltransferase
MSDSVRPTRAIIIAAGMGRRLQPYTDDRPKSMVPINGKPMLLRLLRQLRGVGVTDIVIIRGYMASYFDQDEVREELGPGVRFVENAEFKDNNILLSLFKAENELAGDLYITYSDILFDDSVVPKLADSPHPFGLIVDREWAKLYIGRTDHPVSAARARLTPSAFFAAHLVQLCPPLPLPLFLRC